MGIERNVALVVIREHSWRPISGNVLLIARQTMFFSPEDAIGMLRESGLPVPAVDFLPDTKTRLANKSYIRDDDFFRLLGIPNIKALDVSEYEGADIVHDLNTPIPVAVEGIADFLLDGSTLDNVFDPATALRNFARLLKPGGRLVSINVASNHYDPYLILTPHWLLDYFIVNGFSDCKVYIFVYDGPNGGMNVFTPDLALMGKDYAHPHNLTSSHSMGVVVMAEKGPNSTWDRTPIQHQYRSDWDQFDAKLSVIRGSKRPEVARSTTDCFLTHPEYLFVDQDGVKRKASMQTDLPTDGTVIHPVTCAPTMLESFSRRAPVALRRYPRLYRLASRLFRGIAANRRQA